jgi:hypothetical protein
MFKSYCQTIVDSIEFIISCIQSIIKVNNKNVWNFLVNSVFKFYFLHLNFDILWSQDEKVETIHICFTLALTKKRDKFNISSICIYFCKNRHLFAFLYIFEN